MAYVRTPGSLASTQSPKGLQNVCEQQCLSCSGRYSLHQGKDIVPVSTSHVRDADQWLADGLAICLPSNKARGKIPCDQLLRLCVQTVSLHSVMVRLKVNWIIDLSLQGGLGLVNLQASHNRSFG